MTSIVHGEQSHGNESTFIPKGALHSLENSGEITLEVIEIQSGDYFGEDDIEVEDGEEETLEVTDELETETEDETEEESE